MRLEPIGKPKGIMMRIAFWMTRWQLGKVITPMNYYNLINLPLEIESDGLCAIAQARMA